MKKLLLTAFIASFCVVITAQVSSKEKMALVDLYTTTHGDQWKQSWNLNTPVSEWQGVTVEDDKVTSISLLFNNITGVLPTSIGDLVHLKTLELSFNNIEGTLPPTLGNLKNLEVLAFNGNSLSGTIPGSIGNLINLKQLHLSSNILSGSVPASINDLKELEVFNVFDNSLSGALPVELANNGNLKELMVAENDFTNTELFSIVLMSNSGTLDLEKSKFVAVPKQVIAIESSDDN